MIYADRGHERTIVLIPGWATDYRIFNTLDLKFNYLLPEELNPSDFIKSLPDKIKELNIKKISLLGWSMGGFIAAEFASKYLDLIDELILISIRKRYIREELAQIKGLLKKNTRAYLYKFYNDSFFKRENMRWFKDNLIKPYCDEFDTDYLIGLLDYLGRAEISAKLLEPINKIKFIHGEHDRVAPIKEAVDVSNSLKKSEFMVIKDTGHMVFLEAEICAKV